MIKVILQTDVPGQGKKGDIVNVSDGFARNFLLPQSKAVVATNETIQVAEKEQKSRLAEERKLLEKNETLKNQLEKTSIEIKKKTEGGKLFGSINAKDVITALENKGINISLKNVTIEKPIKSLGTHIIGIVLDKNNKAELKVNIVGE